MTQKVLEICSLVLNNLESRKSEVPLRLTFMIRLLLDEAHPDTIP